MTSTVTLSAQEKMFLARVADKMVSGLSMEDAGQAVLADDRRIIETYQRCRSYDKAGIAHKIAHQVFAGIHTRLAEAR